MSNSEMHQALHQFELKKLIPIELAGYDISFTNSSLFMMFAIFFIITFYLFAIRDRKIIPTRMQSMAELSYEFIASMVKDNVGTKGMSFMPFIFTVFMFVLACNLFGMIPYSFTVTSHISVTFTMAAFIFIMCTLVGLIKHGMHFFSLFLPEGTPLWLAPVMIVIEFFTYLSRPVTLSIRLAGNMVAGHILLKVMAGFVITLGLIGGWLPLSLMVVLSGFELFVAVLQAYIFTILTCVYLNDAVNLH
jgi:F-type H+-transporting ATPase subunit a